jgi:hypothetical protein
MKIEAQSTSLVKGGKFPDYIPTRLDGPPPRRQGQGRANGGGQPGMSFVNRYRTSIYEISYGQGTNPKKHRVPFLVGKKRIFLPRLVGKKRIVPSLTREKSALVPRHSFSSLQIDEKRRYAYFCFRGLTLRYHDAKLLFSSTSD